MVISIQTRHELLQEKRAVALLEFLIALTRSCDPMCQTVAESILPGPHLEPTDFSMSCRVTKARHALLLTLLAVPTFKSQLAAAYCDTYRCVTAQYAKGMGVLERSSFTLSVQFVNRVTCVVDLNSNHAICWGNWVRPFMKRYVWHAATKTNRESQPLRCHSSTVFAMCVGFEMCLECQGYGETLLF